MKEKAPEMECERENESKWESEEKEGDRNTSGKNERRGKGRKLDTVEEESVSTEAEINGSEAEKKTPKNLEEKVFSPLHHDQRHPVRCSQSAS